MNVTITPALLQGAITPPPSKSQAHRLIIAACLAGGTGRVDNVDLSQDILATLGCMEALGASWSRTAGGGVQITGLGGARPPAPGLPAFDCGESGSTLRFLIPIALAAAGGGVFSGRGRLMERPQEPYLELFREKGVFYEQKDGVLTVSGALTPGTYALRGDVSSQFITGLLYALPILDGGSEIVLTTDLESQDYVHLTLDALAQCGVHARRDGPRHITVPGGQNYHPRDCAVEADWSQAGFWYAAAAVGNAVEVTGMNEKSIQGDRAMARFLWQFQGPPALRSMSVAHCPDLVPPLAALAALREGFTEIRDAGRLRIKESDRLATVTQVLSALGAQVEERAESLAITGREMLPGGVTVSSHNDHRIAMMAAVAATRCLAPVTITGAECVAKSYPHFWEDYRSLGGQIEEQT